MNSKSDEDRARVVAWEAVRAVMEAEKRKVMTVEDFWLGAETFNRIVAMERPSNDPET